jgi:predicted MPP superfamily phosphohydrolase
MLLIFLGFRFWVYDFCIHRVEISDKKIPESFDGLKIVQLSDIHLGSWMSSQTLQRAFDKVNAERPDIIVFTGDLVNYVTGEAYPFRENMLSLTAPFGKYAILGNHDYGDYIHWKSQAEHDLNNLALEQFYHETGWQLLNNKHHNLINKTDTIVLAGVENWSQKKLWGQRGNLAKALAGSSNKSVKLLLSHDPTHWDGEVICNYPEILLTLSGHTHAMQIGFESEKFRWSPSSWIFSRWAGLYEHQTSVDDHQFLYVNRGLGHLGFPGRVGIRPEITVITLKKK